MAKVSVETLQNCSSLVEVLRWRAQHQPNQLIYTFLGEKESEQASLTYAELDRQVRAVGAQLLAIKATGKRALLLYPPGLSYVVAFLGCLYAGVVAVPAYPPRHNRSLIRLQSIIEDAQATLALTTRQIVSDLRRRSTHAPNLSALQWLVTDQTADSRESEWHQPSIFRETLAFLQYTSGSTAAPKGVMVSHGNILENEQAIQQAFEHTAEDVIGGWLPLYHDMGLIGNMLQPIYSGASCVLMSPVTFLQSPIRWLQAISHHKVTTSGAPSFAYEMCVQKIAPEQRACLDLSRWEVAFCGAEPIQLDTLDRFAAAFEGCGFRRDALYPCYGLAESTLIVSGSRRLVPFNICRLDATALEENRVVEKPLPTAPVRTLVSCGQSVANQKIRIVDPETKVICSPDRVGEVWVSGPSVAKGYWNQPEISDLVFQARTTDVNEGPFLSTGDLGFLKDGELFITGRIKDLIIIRGRNHYPHDIELTAETCHPALRRNCSAAFSVEVDSLEMLVIVQEVHRRLQQVDAHQAMQAIRQAIAEQHELQVYAVVLVSPGTIPETSSGKVQRHACRNLFSSGRLNVVASSVLNPMDQEDAAQATSLDIHALTGTAPDEMYVIVVDYLMRQVAGMLKVDPSQINRQVPVIRLGLDSLMSIQLQHAIEVDLGVTLPINRLFQDASIADLAKEACLSLACSPQVPVITRSPEDAATTSQPLSFGQRSLWFVHQLSPENVAYNISGAARIDTEINTAALRRAFELLLDLHAVLRSTFTSMDGEPIQQTRQHQVPFFHEEDASDWSQTRLNDRLTEETNRPFDLERGPLLRAFLFRRSASEYCLLLVIHHIVADFWSIGLLIDKLDVLYTAEMARVPAPLMAPSLGYIDYVHWQAKMLSSPDGEQLWRFWQSQLAGDLPVLNLPTDKPRPPIQTYLGASHSFTINREILCHIKAMAGAEGVTLFTALLAAFEVMLHRYTGQQDILIGSPTTGRTRPEFSHVAGYFVNPIVLRSDSSGNPTFISFLRQTGRRVREALAHQEYPFAALIEKLQIVRDPSRSPLFQVMFVWQKATGDTDIADFALGKPGSHLKMASLPMTSLALTRKGAQFDLSLSMAEHGDELLGAVEYSTDLFLPATIERMAGHFQTLLEGITAAPQTAVSDLPLLTDQERHQILVEWTDTGYPYPDHLCLHQLIEHQVESTPNAVAVVCQYQTLTYEQLNCRANQLSHYLRSIGVGPGSHVAICVERSLEMVVGLLGILKAGGAYIPLDPAYPRERLAFMLKDGQAQVLLTQGHLATGLPQHAARVVCLDIESERIGQESTKNPRSGGHPEDLIYVIYTSGSTGKPKGTGVFHRSFVNLLYWFTTEFQMSPADRLLLVGSLGFDLTQKNVFAPLLTGGQLHLLADNYYDPAAISEAITEQHITLLNCTPSAFYPLVEGSNQAELTGLSSLRLLFLGGEPIEMVRLRAWTGSAGFSCEVVNTYGPTECTDVVTFHRVENLRRSDDAGVPLGKPIANAQAYVLDEHLHPVPVGMPGELYIGGVCVGAGYVNDLAMTEARFLANPFSSVLGERMYGTGDRVQWRADGNLEFLGRLDHQVKIRGNRIELGEVEAALRQMPWVKEAVVVAREDILGDKRLVAYCVPIATPKDSPFSVPDLRQYLKDTLPTYMVPSAFVALEQMPLSPNGKLDRNALPPPGLNPGAAEERHVAPRTPVEEVLCAIWAEVLGLERVGVSDNFFELGGDSLLSIRMVAKANQAGLRITPRNALQHQTVAQLAGMADKIPCSDTEQGLVTGPVPLTPIQHRFFEKFSVNPNYYVVSMLFQTTEAINPQLLEKAVAYLMNHHDVLRTRFTETEEGWEQTITFPEATVPFHFIDLSILPPDEQPAALISESESFKTSLSLTEGPILRIVLFNLSDSGPTRLLIIIHHIVLDDESITLLLEDFWAVYGQMCYNTSVNLPAKTTPYKRWAELLRASALSDIIRQEQHYWVNLPWDTVASVPLDHPENIGPPKDKYANLFGSIRDVIIEFNPQETMAFMTKVAALDDALVTDVLLAALATAYRLWSGQHVLLIEMVGHGRRDISSDEVNVSRTVGWFTAHWPAVLDLRNVAGFEASLRAVAAQLRHIPHGGINYGLLRYMNEGSGVAETLRTLPQAQIMFDYEVTPHADVLGRYPMSRAPESFNPARKGPGNLDFLLKVNARLHNGRLRVRWGYSSLLHEEVTIQRLSGFFTEVLRAFIT